MSAETIPAEVLYLIRKGGLFYRPNSQGYTAHTFDAGRYTLAEAEAITHPNGPDGPRDGLSYVPAPADRSTRAAEPAATVDEAGDGEVVAWEARFAEAVEIAQDKFAWKAPLEVVELQSDLLALLRDYASTLEAERTRADAAEQRAAEALARAEKAEGERDAYHDALTPNGDTKALMIGEFFEEIEVRNPDYDGESLDEDEDDEPEFITHRVPVSWTTTKAMMERLRSYAHRLSDSREAQPATDGGANG